MTDRSDEGGGVEIVDLVEAEQGGNAGELLVADAVLYLPIGLDLVDDVVADLRLLPAPTAAASKLLTKSTAAACKLLTKSTTSWDIIITSPSCLQSTLSRIPAGLSSLHADQPQANPHIVGTSASKTYLQPRLYQQCLTRPVPHPYFFMTILQNLSSTATWVCRPLAYSADDDALIAM